MERRKCGIKHQGKCKAIELFEKLFVSARHHSDSDF